MAYFRMKLQENENGECVFECSHDVSHVLRNVLNSMLEIQYLQREEDSGENLTIRLKNVPEESKAILQRAAMQMLINVNGKISDN